MRPKPEDKSIKKPEDKTAKPAGTKAIWPPESRRSGIVVVRR